MTKAVNPPLPAADYVGAFASHVEVDPRTSCLVIVDLQVGLAARSAGLGRVLAAAGLLDGAEYRFGRIERLVVPNTVRLLNGFRRAGSPVVYLVTGSSLPDYSDVPPHVRELFRATNMRVGERDHAVVAAVAPRPGEAVLAKSGMSAFTSTALDATLRSWGTRTLVFAGLTTNMCVEHNVRDAADRGYGCVVVDDACATDTPAMHEAALRNVGRLYGCVATADDVLAQLRTVAAGV